MPSEKIVKVVLDTNTIVSALLGKDGKPAEVLKAVGLRKAVNHISEDILAEVRSVLTRQKITEKTSEHEREAILNIVESLSVKVTPKRKPNIIKEDPADNKILACALEAKADYIISGDKHPLNLRECEGIKIINSNEFLRKY